MSSKRELEISSLSDDVDLLIRFFVTRFIPERGKGFLRMTFCGLLNIYCGGNFINYLGRAYP